MGNFDTDAILQNKNKNNTSLGLWAAYNAEPRYQIPPRIVSWQAGRSVGPSVNDSNV
jgi:hypothetical protein